MIDEPDISQALVGFAGTRRKVRIKRKTPCEPLVNGFVLTANHEWFLFWQFHDFSPDGLTLLRMDGVSHIRFGDYERHWMKMLAGEGAIETFPEPQLRLDDLRSMLVQLQQAERNIIIQCEDEDEDVEDFHIGRLIDVQYDRCAFANFDALGCWDSELHEIELDEITRIQLDTPYCNTFSRYLSEACPFSAAGRG